MNPQGKRNPLLSTVALLCIICSVIFAPKVKPASGADSDANFCYYSGGRKNILPLSKEMLAVRFKQGVSFEQQKTIAESEEKLAPFSQRKELSAFKLAILPLCVQLTEQDVVQTINNLNTKAEVEAAFPVFHFPDAELILTDEFIVEFNPSVSEDEIKAFNALNNVEVVRKPQWTNRYTLRVKDSANMNALKMANLYYESPITKFAMPNFARRLEPMSVTPNDTYFPNQWALDNTGQIPPGGTPNADMNAPEGWEISTGSSDIVIAIIDTGVDLTHEDLVNKLVSGYDFTDGDNNPTPGNYPEDAHGTACAGLAAAETNNGKGIAGVCWNCKIMPIRVFYMTYWGSITTDEWLAGSIEWAADNGADVLSNSWGGGPDSDIIHNAIIEAKNNGRDGKGCVIVFSSGNDYGSVSYPAKYPEVIAVGATDEDDVRWSYSNYGSELDVVAPSSDGHSTILWTTDIMGSAGYNSGSSSSGDPNGNYTKWFGGTSAAAPQVAGLAGLILSVNPNLTSDEVQTVIEDFADDKGDSGWDEKYGWGRINVFNALANTSSLFLDKVDDINDGAGVVPGEDIHYTISYANPTVGTLTDVNIVDYLPDDLVFSFASGPNSVYHPSARTVTWNIGTLEPNDSCSVTLTVKVNDCITGCGTITNYCKIKGGDWARWACENTPVGSASNPNPTCGSIVDLYVCDPNLHLTWCPGRFAAKVNGHEVYFGSNFNVFGDFLQI